ncbi:hypothetical protein [Zooshikella ganghwensis]|nr:hypothetical protein [Zooshikella ganghwensis]
MSNQLEFSDCALLVDDLWLEGVDAVRLTVSFYKTIYTHISQI